MNWKHLSGVAAAALMTAAIVAPAEAQVTTSDIRGTVFAEDGSAVSGATVTITNTGTGLTRSTTTTAAGGYTIRSLPVGPGYELSVAADAYQSRTVQGIALQLGDTTELDVALAVDAQRTLDAIVVTASASDLIQTATGPNATFDLSVLQNAPAINRSIGDVIRLDPRIYVDEAFVDGIQCAGANPRFNSLTVDGVRLNDSFGLNSNGFPTERMPFGFDAINQVAVELAPFDVQYGSFTACNINAVTKSGTNEIHGSLFYDYTDDEFRGDTLEGDKLTLAPFDEQRYGINISGPIIKDKLFFFAAYEKLEGANTFDRGPVGSGAVDEVEFLSQADYDRIVQISNDVYNYDPGGTPQSRPNEDEKILIKLDWNINENHRANFTYNYNDGFNWSQSDGDSNEFEFEKHLYERGAELNSYVGSVYSDWTDNFSTEVRLGYLELVNRQISVEDQGFSEIQISVTNPDNNQRGTVYLGGDDSRQANRLNYDVTTFAAKGFYDYEDHSFLFGFEREEVDIFNLFVQHYQGQIDFNSIDDFENLLFDDYDYANAVSGNVEDAAAQWGYALNTVYLQDDWAITPDFTLTAGLRYDYYESDDVPVENPEFLADYGFSNAQNLDGADLLQPRLGFDWDATDKLKIRGGVGLYSGGNPNVWLSNNYSGSNMTQVTATERNLDFFDDQVTQLSELTFVDTQTGTQASTIGYGVPLELRNEVLAGNGGNFEINALDPNFEIPSEWKYSLGATYFLDVPLDGPFGGDYVLNGDVIVSQGQDSAIIQRLDLVQDGTTAGGLPTFDSPGVDAFVLTNGEGNEAFNISGTISKSHDFGLDWTFGYAYSDAEDEQPMTSSVAFSNYNNRSFTNPNASGLATSNYNIEHRFTFNAFYSKEFVEGFETTVGGFFQARSGRPFSYVFDDANSIYGFTPFLTGSVQFYVPDGLDDPNVVFADGFDTAGLINYINQNDLGEYAGGFAPRNGFEGDWWSKVDLRIEQEFPGFRPDDRTSAFIVIDNFTNLLNDEWGVLYDPSFPRNTVVVDTSIDNVDGRDVFVFEEFIGERSDARVGDPSLWSIRFGVKYDF